MYKPRILMALVLALAVAPGAWVAAHANDITGNWSSPPGVLGGFHEEADERWDGPEVGDYAGIPLNEAGRLRANTWDGSLLTVPEHQCMPHPPTYAFRGPGAPRITADIEHGRLVAYGIAGLYRAAERKIWMDGRARPPAHAPHTWNGFSTGSWQGYMLRVETTHLKPGWLRRNGVAHTEHATLIEYFMRRDNVLTIMTVVVDPALLTEPYVKTTDYYLNPAPPAPGFGSSFCFPVSEVSTDKHRVPFLLPGANPGVEEWAARWKLPVEAAAGGAQTMYPEYALKLHDLGDL